MSFKLYKNKIYKDGIRISLYSNPGNEDEGIFFCATYPVKIFGGKHDIDGGLYYFKRELSRSEWANIKGYTNHTYASQDFRDALKEFEGSDKWEHPMIQYFLLLADKKIISVSYIHNYRYNAKILAKMFGELEKQYPNYSKDKLFKELLGLWVSKNKYEMSIGGKLISYPTTQLTDEGVSRIIAIAGGDLGTLISHLLINEFRCCGFDIMEFPVLDENKTFKKVFDITDEIVKEYKSSSVEYKIKTNLEIKKEGETETILLNHMPVKVVRPHEVESKETPSNADTNIIFAVVVAAVLIFLVSFFGDVFIGFTITAIAFLIIAIPFPFFAIPSKKISLSANKKINKHEAKAETDWEGFILAGITFLIFGYEKVALIIIGIISLVIGGILWLNYYSETAPQREAARLERKRIEEASERERQERIAMQQEEEEQKRRAEIYRYQELRKEIEAMPQYEHWRQEVFKEFGRKCIICRSTENLEIDHRYKSFHAIIRNYGITNTIQAYQCSALWDVGNGAPVCKDCHDQTTSSMYRASKI